jgi:hypothetical protein
MPLTPETSNSQPKHPVEIFRPRFARFLKTVHRARRPRPVPSRSASPRGRPRIPSRSGTPDRRLYTRSPRDSAGARLVHLLVPADRGNVPTPHPRGRPLDLRFSTRTEATLWLDLGRHAEPGPGVRHQPRHGRPDAVSRSRSGRFPRRSSSRPRATTRSGSRPSTGTSPTPTTAGVRRTRGTFSVRRTRPAPRARSRASRASTGSRASCSTSSTPPPRGGVALRRPDRRDPSDRRS